MTDAWFLTILDLLSNKLTFLEKSNNDRDYVLFGDYEKPGVSVLSHSAYVLKQMLLVFPEHNYGDFSDDDVDEWVILMSITTIMIKAVINLNQSM